MDLKTRIEVLPCGMCEEMMGCDTCLYSKEAHDLYYQIRAEVIEEFIDKFIKRTQLRQMTKAECISVMHNIADELKENK